MSETALVAIQAWIDDYKSANSALLDGDPEFSRWLDEDYIPMGGAWQY